MRLCQISPDTEGWHQEPKKGLTGFAESGRWMCNGLADGDMEGSCANTNGGNSTLDYIFVRRVTQVIKMRVLTGEGQSDHHPLSMERACNGPPKRDYWIVMGK